MKKTMFAQICKVDTILHEVWGIATEEREDSDGEVFDYDKSKPHFEAWSKHAEDVTGGLSKGAVRYMHQLDAIGKLIDIQFDDSAKRITVGAKIVDNSAWEKIVQRVLTGFSIGGKVLGWVKNKFECAPIEVSMVDVPCLPTAVFQVVKADGSIEEQHFLPASELIVYKLNSLAKEVQALKTINKSEGKTKRVAGEDLPASAFAYVGDKNDLCTWKLPIHFSSEEKSKRHVRNALARFNQTQGIPEGEKEKVHAKILAAAKRYGIDSGEESEKTARIIELMSEPGAVTKAMEAAELTKSLGSINDLTSVLMTLRWVLYDTRWEADYEGGGGDERDAVLAVELEAAMEHLIEVTKEMLDEETSELLGKAAEVSKGEVMNLTEVQKKAKTMADHFRKAAGHHTAMAEHHKAMAKEHGDLEEAHKAAMGACKADMEEAAKAQSAFHKEGAACHKALSARHEKCMKAHEAMADHHGKMAENHDEEEKAAKAAIAKAAGTAGEDGSMNADDIKKAVTEGMAEAFKANSALLAGTATDPKAEPMVTKAAMDAEIAKAVEANTKAQADTVAKAIADGLAAITVNIEKAVTDKVDAALKAADASSMTQVPVSFTLVPRVNKAAGGDGGGTATLIDDNDCGI